MTLSPTYLTQEQRAIVSLPLSGHTFLSGPAGTGKTTAAVERLLHLLESDLPGSQVLVMVPQRTLGTPYYEALNSSRLPPGGMVDILTIGGLARRNVELFWPLIAEEAGFANPNQPPVFLTMETAQYYMAHLVQPLLAVGYFDAVALDRNRLYSQLLDNLNKAALNGFPYTEIGGRLTSAWIGEQAQRRVYTDVQDCLDRFRRYCLQYNLLDFSLQIETFLQQLWPFPLFREHLHSQYRHLLFDNLEEDTPVTARLLEDWLPDLDSALLVYDLGGGYRRFLGADPERTASLAELCSQHFTHDRDLVTSEGIIALRTAMKDQFVPDTTLSEPSIKNFPIEFPRPPIRFYPDMLDWVTDQIANLVEKGNSPGEIVVLAPYFSDALRYSLVDRLERRGLPCYSHRPSRALRDEPAARCLLALAKLAHPSWDLLPLPADFTYALMQAIADLDLVRAQLLSRNVYRRGRLSPFEEISPADQQRITYLFGGRYEDLRRWLQVYLDGEPQELDHFLSRLFGEVISQPGYGFHDDPNAGEVAANLVESIMKFRRVSAVPLAAEGIQLGKEYLEMVESGVIAAQYLSRWRSTPQDAVFLAPAYTFLMTNRPVDYQFWLDVGGRGWYERLYQPLTHPHVLSWDWPVGQPWTDSLEKQAAAENLQRLSLGLLHRCRQGVFLGLSTLNEGGFEHKGELLQVIDQAIRE